MEDIFIVSPTGFSQDKQPEIDAGHILFWLMEGGTAGSV